MRLVKRGKLFPNLQYHLSNFGDLPFIGGVIKTALDYEDRANYRDADPRLREMMGLTKSKPKPRGLQFKDGKTGGLGGFLPAHPSGAVPP